MLTIKRYGWLITLLLCNTFCFSQGPPITGDKPIMLGGNSWVIRSLTEIRNTNIGAFIKAPLIVHYLPSANALVGIHLPIVKESIANQKTNPSLGDLEILAKYQIYRKDGVGKTFRVTSKTVQIFPTGKPLNIQGISMATYQSYVGFIAGYESLAYGISNELGYNYQPTTTMDEIRHKLSIGLPLMKPSYPVKKLSLYFEYQSSWFTNLNAFLLTYAQGIQYARGQFTIESAIQTPLIQSSSDQRIQRNYSVFLGARYIF